MQNILTKILGISSFLHSEAGKKYLAYWYPKIKEFSRKWWNLGIYEYLENGYRVVDDTFYGGEVSIELEDPLDVARLEKAADGVMSLTEAQDYGASLPNFHDIKDELLIWKSIEQGRTYRCDTFARNNMLRSAMLTAGLKPQSLEVMAIDPAYIATKHGLGKTGTVVENAIIHAGKNGLPIPAWTLMSDHNKELEELENSKTVSEAYKFVTRAMTGEFKTTSSFDVAVNFDRTLGPNWMMQVSYTFCGSLDYFGEKVPYVKKIDGSWKFTRTGGHSTHGVRGSFSTWENGDAGFVIIDSAYRSREDGWRFITKKLMDLGLVRVRFVEFDLGNITRPQIQIDNPADTVTEYIPVSLYDRGNGVAAIQRALISLGYSITAGATGYYGNQTKTAVLQFQRDHQNLFESVNDYYKTESAESASGFGTRFGKDSIKVLQLLLSQ